MAFRLYIVPAIGSGATPEDARRPKYIHALQPPGGEWWDYGFQPLFLCGVDLLPADDVAVVANSDVIAFPFDLDSNISGGQVNAFANSLEAVFIPANWVTGGLSWREIARSVAAMFLFMRRLNGVVGNLVLFDGTANKTLNTQFGSLPANLQNGILTAAAIDNFSTAFITQTTQVRAMLKNLADQGQGRQFTFGPNAI